MKHTTQIPNHHANPTNAAINKATPAQQLVAPTGGLAIRTDLRAGLAWDDLDDQAQALWSSLTDAVSGLIGGNDASS